MNIHHLNCGILHAPPYPKACCHCLLLEEDGVVALVDTGIGLWEVKNPKYTVGAELIDLAGFQFHEKLTAIRQIVKMGYPVNGVKHIILTHCDNDHCGGLADFPNAVVHVSAEEFDAFKKGSYRYSKLQFAHNPTVRTYSMNDAAFLGLPARKIDLPFRSDVLLIPLFGHTMGHCGVAVSNGDKWVLYIGDAYYLRSELDDGNHLVSELAQMRAENNELRIESLQKIKKLAAQYKEQVDFFGYHDFTELNGYIK